MVPSSKPYLLIQSESQSDSSEVDQVRAWLREFNWHSNQKFMEVATKDANFAKPLILLARHEDQLVGGLIAEHVLAWLKISIMAVDPDHRGKGIGSSLLIDAEQRAQTVGCKYLYADTMQYQAPQFYIKHGFQVAGQIPNWDSHGHAKFFLIKEV